MSSQQSEVKRWRLWRDERDIEARDSLIEQYLRLVPITLARMSRSLPPDLRPGDEDWRDLEAEGTVGLMMAIEKFDPSRGTSFPDYAMKWIRGEVLRFLRTQNFEFRAVSYEEFEQRQDAAIAVSEHERRIASYWTGPADPRAQPEEEAVAALSLNEKQERLKRKIDRLPAFYRRFATDYLVLGKLTEEICKEWDLSNARIKVIRRETMQRLEEMEEPPPPASDED